MQFVHSMHFANIAVKVNFTTKPRLSLARFTQTYPQNCGWVLAIRNKKGAPSTGAPT